MNGMQFFMNEMVSMKAEEKEKDINIKRKKVSSIEMVT